MVVKSNFLGLSFDLSELSEVVTRLLDREYELKILGVRCTYPVFRGDSADASSVFVKIGTREEWARTSALLKAVGGSGLFAKFLVDHPVEFHGYVLFVMDWRGGEVVRPEDMTDAQIAGFVSGCQTLSSVLQNARGIVPDVEGTDEPERLFGVVEDYVRRHPFAGRLLKDLMSISADLRTYGARELSVVHGDFHSKNFAFEGDALACVFDFDRVSLSLACGDLVNALVERFSCLSLSSSVRRRLSVAARKILATAPWSREEMRIMANLGRLKFAVHRLEKHPDSAWVAIDVLRRDRKIRELLACGLEG